MVFRDRDLRALSADELRDLRGPGDRDDLPGSAHEPQSDVHRRAPDDRRAACAPQGRPRHAAPARAGAARAGRHPRRRRAPGRLPAPVLGRHAAAHHDRHGAAARAGAADRGRADECARRHARGPDRRAAAAAARQPRHGDPVRLARPRRDLAALRQGRGDVRGPRRRAGVRHADLHGAAAPLHAGAPCGRAVRSPPRRAARDHPGTRAEPLCTAVRLRLPPALPARPGRLHARRATRPAAARRQPRAVPHLRREERLPARDGRKRRCRHGAGRGRAHRLGGGRGHEHACHACRRRSARAHRIAAHLLRRQRRTAGTPHGRPAPARARRRRRRSRVATRRGRRAWSANPAPARPRSAGRSWASPRPQPAASCSTGRTSPGCRAGACASCAAALR